MDCMTVYDKLYSLDSFVNDDNIILFTFKNCIKQQHRVYHKYFINTVFNEYFVSSTIIVKA